MANITEEADDNSFPEDHSGDEEEFSNPEEEENEESNDTVTRLLQQLKNSGAIKKVEKVTPSLSIPFSTSAGFTIKQEGLSIKPVPKALELLHCKTCDIDFDNSYELNSHLVEHVKLPYIVVEKLLSDDEDEDNVDNWSDEEIEQEAEIPAKGACNNSDILKKLGGGISIGKSPVKSEIINTNPQVLKAIIRKVPISSSQPASSPRSDSSEDPKSPSTTGSLKLTIKHSSVGKKDNFHVVSKNNFEDDASNELSVKEEPFVLTQKEQPNSNEKTNLQQSVTAKDTTPSVPSNMTNAMAAPSLPKSWDTVDTKDGILEANLIKKEPIIHDLPSIPPQPLPVPQSRIKDEPGLPPAQPVVQQPPEPVIPKPMIIPKKEPESSVAIIEINGDDSDNDDIMFVDSTPPVDKKPNIGVISTASITEIPTSGFPTNQTSSQFYGNANMRTPTTPLGSTEKQHNFNWHAPSKSLDSILSEKSPDAILQNLLDSHQKESNSDLGASEYISLDTLGPKHTCDVCQTRFTDLRMLESHRKATGHSNQIVTMGANSSNAIVPSNFGGNSSLMAMSNLFPVKQLAEVAGKLAGASNSGFSHQQNIMVNIHSFAPGNVPPQMPGGYAPQQMPGYQPGYRMPDPNQAYPYPQNNYPQYPNQPGAPQLYPNSQMPPGYPQQYPSQYPPYQNQNQYPPGQVPPNQTMGQLGQGMSHPGQMMGQPPGFASMHDTTGTQSPSKLGVMGGIKIQNSQSPAAGQKLTQAPGARIAPGAVRAPIRPAMRGRGGGQIRPVRPVRPTGPGQLMRGGKPVMRTPIKRPSESSPNTTPTKKRLDMLLPDRNDNDDCHVLSMQKQREGVPFIESIKGRQESMQLGSGLTVTKTRVRPPTPPQNKDASAVANMLAQRGIKITAKQKPPTPPPVAIPNLGSDICIKKKPTTSSSSFHIPEDRDSLSLKCDMCHMSYSSFSQLQEHKRQFHNIKSEMGLPVVDLSDENNLIKLSNLGIMNFIPLANREQSGGCYGIPIVSVHNALNGSLNNSLQSLGAGGILSLGPVKPLPKC